MRANIASLNKCASLPLSRAAHFTYLYINIFINSGKLTLNNSIDHLISEVKLQGSLDVHSD